MQWRVESGRSAVPLTLPQRAVLAVQVALAAGFAAIGLVAAGGSDGWADLARVAVAVLAGGYLLGALLAAVIARRWLASGWARLLLLVAGPPAGLLATVLAVRAG
jgi:hypothetical protein